MGNQAPDPSFHKRDIHFPNGNLAHAILFPPACNVSQLLDELELPKVKALLVIAGGAAHMHNSISTRLSSLFLEGIAASASSLKALILDGGTQAGVMALIGEGVAQQQRKPPLLGVAPYGAVSYPGKEAKHSEIHTAQQAPLEPNHSHFVLVEAEIWGQETETMYGLVALLAKGRPSLTVLVNGGEIAQHEVVYNVRQNRPIIVIEGSGRTADRVMSILNTTSLDQDDFSRIVHEGDFYPFPLTGSPTQLAQLIQRLIQH